MGSAEEDVVEKQDGASCNRHVGVPKEDVIGNQVGAVRIRSGR